MSNQSGTRGIGLGLLAALAITVASGAGTPAQAATLIRHGGRHAGGTMHGNGRALGGLHNDRERAARADHRAGFGTHRRLLP